MGCENHSETPNSCNRQAGLDSSGLARAASITLQDLRVMTGRMAGLPGPQFVRYLTREEYEAELRDTFGDPGDEHGGGEA